MHRLQALKVFCFSCAKGEKYRLDQCVAENPKYYSANLGAEILGERLTRLDFEIDFKTPATCRVLCRRLYDPKDAKSMINYNELISGIKQAYNRYWVSDNIPVIICYETVSGEVCERNFPLGCFKTDAYKPPVQCRVQLPEVPQNSIHIFNHFSFNINYTEASPGKYHLISVKVTPRSIVHNENEVDCSTVEPLRLFENPNIPVTVIYTYSVQFSEVQGAARSSRWNYLISKVSNSSIQWMSIVNSVLVVVFLTALVAIVLARTLRRDIMQYNKLENSSNEMYEDYGWKLIHGDVFRAPPHPMLFSVLIGSGIQLALVSVITLFFACFGILSPAHRGAFATCALAVFVCLGAPAGYTSARFYKFFGGIYWKTNILLTGLFCPGFVMVTFLVLNIVLAALKSSAAASFSTILSLLAMWLLVSLPLCCIGSFFGFRREVITVPTRTNQIPRQVPPQSYCIGTFIPVFLTGLLSFGCISIQLFFIFNSIWGQQLFFMFGFLFLVFVFFLVCVVETTILMCYLQLRAGDYRWWWRSFVSSGSTTVFVLAYAIHYYIYKTEYRGFTSGFLYIGFSTLAASLLFIMLGKCTRGPGGCR
ncbi:unnamed protein product [Mesocestoides corti]|uniref:Transmembrane 9 superfamily member n=1 Tax=Mesocestoides corti TaxID=53468 RepID=A0A0R3UMG6_MESCO|nr:unnamed protein product [Mesocestoides corti]